MPFFSYDKKKPKSEIIQALIPIPEPKLSITLRSVLAWSSLYDLSYHPQGNCNRLEGPPSLIHIIIYLQYLDKHYIGSRQNSWQQKTRLTSNHKHLTYDFAMSPSGICEQRTISTYIRPLLSLLLIYSRQLSIGVDH